MKISMKALRINAGYTQEKAAEELSVSKKTLQNWESYTTFPSGQQLVQMCALYGCELTDIFLPEMLAKSE